jgi:hypothetical protein
MASQSPTELMDHSLRMFLEGSQGTTEGQAMLMELVCQCHIQSQPLVKHISDKLLAKGIGTNGRNDTHDPACI